MTVSNENNSYSWKTRTIGWKIGNIFRNWTKTNEDFQQPIGFLVLYHKIITIYYYYGVMLLVSYLEIYIIYIYLFSHNLLETKKQNKSTEKNKSNWIH